MTCCKLPSQQRKWNQIKNETPRVLLRNERESHNDSSFDPYAGAIRALNALICSASFIEAIAHHSCVLFLLAQFSWPPPIVIDTQRPLAPCPLVWTSGMSLPSPIHLIFAGCSYLCRWANSFSVWSSSSIDDSQNTIKRVA